MARLNLDAGACGYKVIITAVKKGKRRYRVTLRSPCTMVQSLNEEIQDMVLGPDIFSNILDSPVYRLSSKHLKHVSCPLPSAILKAIEVEDDLAIAKDVLIKVKED